MVERIRSDAPVLVIGLGRFGAACAGELDRLDREVLAIDENLELVQKWSERVTHTVQSDARNIDALRQIGAQDFQVAVVAVGSSIEASGDEPAELRRRVTSPKGTTERAVAVLHDARLDDVFARATDAALARARELAAGA